MMDYTRAEQGEDVKTTTKRRSKLKPILLCCGANGRAVVYGRVETDPVPGEPVVILGARMILYWSVETCGVFGLAARGPGNGCRITAAVERVVETVWQEALSVSAEASIAIDAWGADA